MIKAVVFDLDHTLYDRDASDRIAMGHYFDDHPDTFMPGVTREQAAEAHVAATHAHIYEGWHAIEAELVEKGILCELPDHTPFLDYFMDQLGRFGVPYDFAKPTFARLREMGLKLGLITNGRRDRQEHKIRGQHMEHDFDEILIGSDPATAKPHPDLFLEMAHLLSCEPDEMIYAGDNPFNDVDASRSAGYHAVWVKTLPPWRWPDVREPELQVDTVAELPDLVEKLNGN